MPAGPSSRNHADRGGRPQGWTGGPEGWPAGDGRVRQQCCAAALPQPPGSQRRAAGPVRHGGRLSGYAGLLPMASGLCFRSSARPLSSVGQSCGLLIRRSWVRAPQGVPRRPRPRKGPGPSSYPRRRQQRTHAALPGHAFGLRDGCWNRVSSGGANPRKVNTPASRDGRAYSCRSRLERRHPRQPNTTSFHSTMKYKPGNQKH